MTKQISHNWEPIMNNFPGYILFLDGKNIYIPNVLASYRKSDWWNFKEHMVPFYDSKALSSANHQKKISDFKECNQV